MNLPAAWTVHFIDLLYSSLHPKELQNTFCVFVYFITFFSCSSCFNGGTCVDGINTFTCLCPPGFTGIYCQHDINECDSKPCLNGGTCHDSYGTYKCTCPHGYTGLNCQVGGEREQEREREGLQVALVCLCIKFNFSRFHYSQHQFDDYALTLHFPFFLHHTEI